MQNKTADTLPNKCHQMHQGWYSFLQKDKHCSERRKMKKCIMTIGVLITIIAFCLVPQALDGIHIRVCIVPILIVLVLGGSLIAWAVTMKNIKQSDTTLFIATADFDTSWWDTYQIAEKYQDKNL